MTHDQLINAMLDASAQTQAAYFTAREAGMHDLAECLLAAGREITKAIAKAAKVTAKSEAVQA